MTISSEDLRWLATVLMGWAWHGGIYCGKLEPFYWQPHEDLNQAQMLVRRVIDIAPDYALVDSLNAALMDIADLDIRTVELPWKVYADMDADEICQAILSMREEIEEALSDALLP